MNGIGSTCHCSGASWRRILSLPPCLAGPHADLPGCLLPDVAMPWMDGMALQQALTARAAAEQCVNCND